MCIKTLERRSEIRASLHIQPFIYNFLSYSVIRVVHKILRSSLVPHIDIFELLHYNADRNAVAS